MKKIISIVGGGASALFLASALNTDKYVVSVFEKNSALGRKFLVAGDGGLNLTHSESECNFILNYTPHYFLSEAFKLYSNKDFIAWLNGLDIPTFIGTSGRVFPQKGIKPIDVLNAIEKKINSNRVQIYFKHEWKGFSDRNELLFNTKEEIKRVKSDITIFCLGGASWPVTGSKGDWVKLFEEKNVQVNTFKSSNCSFKIIWPNDLIKHVEGKPLKNISVTCNNKTISGELVITAFGIEGSGVYPLSPQIRQELELHNEAKIKIDLKPLLTINEIVKRISIPNPKKTYTENLSEKLNLNKTQLILIKHYLSKEEFFDAEFVAHKIKNFEFVISSLGPLEDAISTVGGISLNEIADNFELKKLKNSFVLGEMIDYDAPTGGYLLQSCFSMANYLANYLNSKE